MSVGSGALAWAVLVVMWPWGVASAVPNGDFDGPDLLWSDISEGDGMPSIVIQGLAFSGIDGSQHVQFPSSPHAMNVRAGAFGSTDDLAGVRSQAFLVTHHAVHWLQRSEHVDVKTWVELLAEGSWALLEEEQVTPSVGSFALGEMDVSAACGVRASVVLRQQTLADGAGYYTLYDDVAQGGEICRIYRDEDGDGFCPSGTDHDLDGLCISPGEPQLGSEPLLDCDDEDATLTAQIPHYYDLDLDGVGAGLPAYFCPDNAPAHWVLVDGDCDDANADVWEPLPYWPDPEGLGIGVGEPEYFCLATAPEGYTDVPPQVEPDTGEPADTGVTPDTGDPVEPGDTGEDTDEPEDTGEDTDEPEDTDGPEDTGITVDTGDAQDTGTPPVEPLPTDRPPPHGAVDPISSGCRCAHAPSGGTGGLAWVALLGWVGRRRGVWRRR